MPAALGLFHRNKENHVYEVDSLLLKRLGSLEKENKVTARGLSWEPENLHDYLKNKTFLTQLLMFHYLSCPLILHPDSSPRKFERARQNV